MLHIWGVGLYNVLPGLFSLIVSTRPLVIIELAHEHIH